MPDIATKVLGVFHGTALVRDYNEALQWLGRFCGCVALQYVEAGAPAFRKGGCCALGDGIIELMEPISEDSPPGKHLRQFGPIFYNIALQVEDLADACRCFTDIGVEYTLPPEKGFTFTRPSGTSGIQFQWSALRKPWDPRFGAALPPAPPALIDTPRIAWWGALVKDPASDAERLATLLGGRPLMLDADAPAHSPAAALSLEDGLLLLYPLPDDEAEERRLWGKAAGRPRLHAMGMRVRDLNKAAEIFKKENVGVLHRNEQELVTNPPDTVGLTIVWTDRDYSFDTRGPLSRP